MMRFELRSQEEDAMHKSLTSKRATTNDPTVTFIIPSANKA